MGDSSTPETGSPPDGGFWRVIAVPRLMLITSGRHRFAAVHRGCVNRFDMKAGDTVFFPPFAHEYEYSTKRFEYLGVVFHRGYLRLIRVINDSPGRGALPPPQWYHWLGRRPDWMRPALEVLESLSSEKPSTETVQAAGRFFWRMLADWMAQTDFQAQSDREEGKAHASWMRIYHYLEEHADLAINRELAAADLGLHSSRIYALCRRFSGMGFQQLLEQKRLERAKKYLAATNLAIEVIARMCGYSGAAYFIRAFRLATGTTPGRWRRGAR